MQVDFGADRTDITRHLETEEATREAATVTEDADLLALEALRAHIG